MTISARLENGITIELDDPQGYFSLYKNGVEYRFDDSEGEEAIVSWEKERQATNFIVLYSEIPLTGKEIPSDLRPEVEEILYKRTAL